MTNLFQSVMGTVAKRIGALQRLPEHPRKAALANLRRGVGTKPGDLPELWGAFLQELPEELLSKTGEPTPGEWAVYLTLTLYALHQQGHDLPAAPMHRDGEPLGSAVHRLVKPDETPEDSAILRRFNALATAEAMPERAHYLRGIVQQLRAAAIPLDYVRLSADLLDLQLPDGAARVRLRWGQDFYRQPNTQDGEAAPKEPEA